MASRDAAKFCDFVAAELSLVERGFELRECYDLGEARYLAVLRSKNLSLRVLSDRGGLELAVGAPDAPAIWEDTVGSRRVWFSPHSIVKLVRNDDHVDVGKALEEIGSSSREAILREWRDSLLAGMPHLEEFFSDGPSDQTLQRLDRFRERLNEAKRKQLEELFRQQRRGISQEQS